jgi:Family of unknown function (DUF6283)
MKQSNRNNVITHIRPAGTDHQVVTAISERPIGYRRKPCGTCPWRVDAVGEFPAEAFRHSANTSYDMSNEEFGCHESGRDKPATCAGYLLRGAAHNLTTRLKVITGKLSLQAVSDDGLQLFESYREMAEANGVPPDDPILAPCRD